jgi:hypothetical protein
VFTTLLATFALKRRQGRKRLNIIDTQPALQANVHEIDGYPKASVARNGIQFTELGS